MKKNMKLPFGKRLISAHFLNLFLPIFLILFVFFFFNRSVQAQGGNWQFDPEVTEVGKNAERSRQLLYWIFTHPPSYTVPVLAQIWGVSRNIVYGMFVLVIAITGLALILVKRNDHVGPIFSGIASPIFGLSLPVLFFRVGVLLIYVTFSYLIVLGLIQTSEIFSRFFAEKYFGCHLFNIKFSQSGTDCRLDPAAVYEMESNYTEFVGYRNTDVLKQESAKTGLLLVKLTTITYNLFSIVLILRQVILWFLLMLSPFLALLLPFIFIRNTGYIWIGIFFQWLFYTPLVSLFLSGLVLIWRHGIPYAFNFTRINQPISQVFPTAINILYGGPGQILTPTNSANYVDTYAEYIIALIMLWVTIFLPWLLLQIFRDYCCDILSKNQAVLLSILDKIRGFGLPPAPSPPPPAGPQAQFKLPFRKTIEEVSKINLQKLQDISTTRTSDLTRSLSLSVSTLTEVARYEMNTQEKRKVLETLNHIANPFIIPTIQDRERFSLIKKELELRAQAGDKEAQQILSAAFKKPLTVTPLPLVRELPEITVKEAVDTLIRETSLTKEKVSELLKELPRVSVNNQVNVLADRLQVPEIKIEHILDVLPQFAPNGIGVETILTENPYLGGEIAKRTNLTEEKVREVLNQFSQTTLSQTERIEKIAKETTTSSEQIRELLTKLPDVLVYTYPQIFGEVAQNNEIIENTARETLTSSEKVREVLQQVGLLEFRKELTREELIKKITKITNYSEEKVAQVFNTTDLLEKKVYTRDERINEISRMTALPKEKISEIFDRLEILQSVTQLTQTGIVASVSQKTGVSERTVQTVLETRNVLTAQNLNREEIINKIAEQTSINKEKVKEILNKTDEEIITRVSQATSVSEEKVRETEKISNLLTAREISRENLVSLVSEKTSLSKTKVEEILRLTEEIKREKQQLTSEEIEKIAQATKISTEEVEKIIKTASHLIPQTAPELLGSLVKEAGLIQRISKETDMPKQTVETILKEAAKLFPQKSRFEDQIEVVSEKTSLPKERVRDVLGTIAAVHLEKPEQAKPRIVRRPAVSIEDYEEVKNMWTNHYKLSEVPVSETIKTREDWLKEDIRVLTNTLNLLTSLNPKDKEKGMKEVASILPFLLLGGFSEVETVVYLKAKLQAAKLTLAQLQESEELKEKLKKEEEETLVEIPTRRETEEKAYKEEEKAKELPFENKDLQDKQN